MEKKRILITGGSGFLGWHLAFLLREKYEIWASYFSHPFTMEGIKTIRLDITDKNGVMERFREIRPEAVIHAAADTNVDRCEEESEEAYGVNVAGTENVLAASTDIGARVVYTSTDLVFGEGKSKYTEEDTPFPINYYGSTKLEGEKRAADCRSAVTLRMALMYGGDTGIKGSFLGWMKRGLESGEGVKLYTDQFRTPLYVDDAAGAIEAVIQGKAKNNTYHIGGPERIDRYRFGCIYADIFGYDPSLIIPVTTDEHALRARRSRDCSLSIENARQDLGFTPRGVRDALSDLKKNSPASHTL